MCECISNCHLTHFVNFLFEQTVAIKGIVPKLTSIAKEMFSVRGQQIKTMEINKIAKTNEPRLCIRNYYKFCNAFKVLLSRY